MKDLIKELVASFLEAGIRFWHNRFQTRNEELEFIRLEMDKLRSENSKLINHILELSSPKIEVETFSSEELKPIATSRIPWHVQRAKMERESREKFEQIQKDRLENKTIEELEAELGVANNG